MANKHILVTLQWVQTKTWSSIGEQIEVGGISSAQTTLLVADTSRFFVTPIQTTLRVDTEEMVVIGVNTQASTITVLRGQNTTVAVAHNAGAEIERQQIENGWLLDPLWDIIATLAHDGQPTQEILPDPNGFTNELIVDEATLILMEASPNCVVIWADDIVEEQP